MMKCDNCGGTEFELKTEDHPYVEAGLKSVVLLDVRVRVCRSCANRFVSIPAIAQLHRMLAEAFTQQTERLSPEEIRFLRKHLGFSSADFADVIGVSKEAVSRWENGHERMGLPAEKLLRLMVQREKPLDEYPNDKLAEVERESSKRPPRRLSKQERGGWVEARV